jgi:hypothetical protein
MSVLFLDVDGVLNNKKMIHSKDFLLCELMIGRLRRIIDETNATIILSSSWRIYEDRREFLRNALERHGLRWADRTPFIGPALRCVEIDGWLERNDVDKYAILDDSKEEHSCFFRTDIDVGLTDEIADQVIAHLSL